MNSGQGKVGCVFPQTINHMHNSFSQPDNLLHEVDAYLVRVGKEWAGPVFPHPRKSKGYMCIHDGVRFAVFSQTITMYHMHNSFQPPDNLLNKVDFKPCQGGEKPAQFFPTPRVMLIRCLLLSVWRKSGTAQFFPSPSPKYNWCWKIWGGEKTDRVGKKLTGYFFLPGKQMTSQFLPRGRNGPAWSFPGERLPGGKNWPLHRNDGHAENSIPP